MTGRREIAESLLPDAAAPRNPVALFSKDLHVLWVNTMSLRLAGIGLDTPDPAGER